MKISDAALLRVLEVIIDECKRGSEVETVWIDLWGIHCVSDYSPEYARQVVKDLYFNYGALQRMKKGAKFLYRPTAKAERVFRKLRKGVS